MGRLKSVQQRVTQVAQQRTASVVDCNSWRSGKTTAERGYGYRWQAARAKFLTANPTCHYCEREGRVSLATVMDHIIPHRGDQRLFWLESNWQPLCKPCHDSVKKSEENAPR